MTIAIEENTEISTPSTSSSSYEQFIKNCSLEAHCLPLNIREQLYNFKTNGNQDGYLLFEGLPANKSEYCLTIYGSLLGEPYSYVQEGDGKLYHDITPFKTHENDISSKSSLVTLDFHTELVFHHFIPDYLLLFCIRGDRNREAKTYVSSIRSCYEEIPPETRQILRKPIYFTGIDHSFGNLDTIAGNGKPVPILYGDPMDPFLNFDPDMMECDLEEGHEAISTLKEILYHHKATLILEPGELLMIDNKRAVHGRTSFRPFYDGRDRFLKRLFITKDLTRAQEVFSKKERIITYKFS